MHPVTRQGNHALHEMLTGTHWIAEDDNVSSRDGLVGKKMGPDTGLGEMNLIDQQVIAHEQRTLHRFRGNLEGLCEEGNDKDRNNYGSAEPLDDAEPMLAFNSPASMGPHPLFGRRNQ